MRVQFVAGFGPIVTEQAESLAFYRDALGLPLIDEEYISTNDLEGVKHFGLWRLEDAAQSIFGTRAWPADVPIPSASIEFDLESEEAVSIAADELKARGLRLLVGPKREEWGQTVLRLLSPEGVLVGITYTPWMH